MTAAAADATNFPIITDTRLRRIQDRVVAREPNQFAPHLEPDNPAMRHARRQTKHRSARTAADIKNELVRLGRHRGGEKYWVDGGTITFPAG